MRLPSEVAQLKPDAVGVAIGDQRVVYPWTGCGHCPQCLAEEDDLCPNQRSPGAAVSGGFGWLVKVPHPRYLLAFDGVSASLAATYACFGLTAYSAARTVLPVGAGRHRPGAVGSLAPTPVQDRPAADCTRIADEYIGARRPIPGFGHPFHTPDVPRTPALFAVAAEARLPGHHVALLRQMSATVGARASKHLTIKATGTIGALLQEIGVPQSIMRAVAVISRCGGLARHIMKERQTKSARTIWKLTEDNIPYVPS